MHKGKEARREIEYTAVARGARKQKLELEEEVLVVPVLYCAIKEFKLKRGMKKLKVESNKSSKLKAQGSK